MDLNKDQIEYIRKNAGKISRRQIARDLGVEMDDVAKYLRRQKQEEPLPRGARSPGALAALTAKAASWSGKLTPKSQTVMHVVLIFLIALLLRFIYIRQLSHTYFFVPFKGGFDDYIFDVWA